MVYCTKCGTKNEEDAAVCIKCGASLASRPAWRPERKRAEEECFGLPHGGAIAGIVFGAIVILAGLIFVLQEMGVIREGWDLIWPLIVIIFGILIVAGALYSYSRRS
jgi:tetrahydromethanopterin S-methyltransferase subunit E